MSGDQDEPETPPEGTRWTVDPSQDPDPGMPNHAAPDGAPVDPLIDLSRDPNPGVPNHASPDDA